MCFQFMLIHPLCLCASQYPKGIAEYDYIPNFTVRGLHYDIQKVRHIILPFHCSSMSFFADSVKVLSLLFCRVF